MLTVRRGLKAGGVLLLALSACRERPVPEERPSLSPELPAAVFASTQPPATPPVLTAVDVPSLAPLVERILPTVVTVKVRRNARASDDEDGAEPGEGDDTAEALPEGHPPIPGASRERAGAGVLLDGHGLILTTFHFVRDASGLTVQLNDGRAYEADLVARDAPTDLALLKLRRPPKGLAVARLGDSHRLHAGDWVLAVGNPFGLSSSVSLGIVSALARRLGGPYDEYLQTDAAINPGSSGGPLFDLNGDVVGIATAVPVAAGIGFAVPSSLVLELLPQLVKDGGVTRGALGALFQDMSPALGRAMGVASGDGALLSGFTPDSAAERAGLMRDDVVVALDGQRMGSRNELIHAVALRAPASLVRVTLVRSGRTQEVEVTLGTRRDLEGTGPLPRPVPSPRLAAAEGSLGFALADLSRTLAARLQVPAPGVVVVSVIPGSAADAAGFGPGVVLTDVGGTPVRTVREATDALRSAHSGRTLLVRVLTPGIGPQLLALEVP